MGHVSMDECLPHECDKKRLQAEIVRLKRQVETALGTADYLREENGAFRKRIVEMEGLYMK